jgi:hypothetical protein
MRAALYSTVAIVVAFSPMQARAADVSEAGAKQIFDKLTYYLPKDIVDTGFLKVTPSSQRYEVSVDIAPFLKNLKPTEFAINGLRPFVQFLTPQNDGTWKVEANDNLNVSGYFTAEGKKSNFTYSIGKYSYESLFDPQLSFFRTSKANVDKLQFSSDNGQSNVRVGIDSYTGESHTDNVNNGVADLTATMSAKGFNEIVSAGPGPGAGQLTFTAESLDGNVKIDKIGFAPLRDLIVFALDKFKANTKTLTADESTRLKALLKANVPFTDDLVEDIRFHNLNVSAQNMQMKLADLGYKIDFNGIKPDTRVGFEFNANDPTVPPGLLPPGTEGAVPKSVSFGVAITGLNLEGVVSYALEHADFTKEDPLTGADSAAIDKIILPDGNMHIEFTNVFARSDVYDVSLTGTMLVNPNDSDKPEADVTIKARDLDKTVNYLQANAAKVPQYGQASFGLLMMKGFGKQESDGSMTWNVKVDKAGKVTINGREMPH